MEPERNCDVVMKGGITSGIVYPEAIQELSKQYRFRSIGGTSAGAIAAAATAAAEAGRRRGDATAFDRFADLPTQLSEPVEPGGPSRLFSLFKPQKATAPIYHSLVAALGKQTLGRRLLAFGAAVVRRYPLWVLGTLILCGAATAAWAQFSLAGGGVLSWLVGLVPPALLTVVVLVIVLAAVFAVRLARSMPENFYGLCTGYADPPPGPDSTDPPLTAYLYNLFNGLAGQPLERPLTFGDLWWPDGARPDPLPADEPDDLAVRLQMMTTNLTHGRPYRLPFLGNEQRLFFFKEEDFRKFFPPPVVTWLKDHARPNPDYPGFIPLPPARDFPVIVGVRMSLSFPILMSAVPLYAIDYTTPGGAREPERCLFSDGGIASNFPVHFFDGPIPRWPTLAINLRPYHRHHLEEHVYKVRTNGDGLAEWWTVIDRGSGVDRLKAFGSAILGAMQNWSDNALLKMPGYRDRVVHVSLAEDQGGINLDMPRDLIQTLGRRGRDAAKLLVGDLKGQPRDGRPVEVTWDNHRWIRLRTYMALLEKDLGHVTRALEHRESGDRSYRDLVARGDAEPPSAYRIPARSRTAAVDALNALRNLVETWRQDVDFQSGAPKPEPELRVRPRI